MAVSMNDINNRLNTSHSWTYICAIWQKSFTVPSHFREILVEYHGNSSEINGCFVMNNREAAKGTIGGSKAPVHMTFNGSVITVYSNGEAYVYGR